jgi:hypothetical protein
MTRGCYVGKKGNTWRGFLASEMFLVVTLAILIFMGTIYGLSQAELYSRDNRRVSDLKQLAHALALYLDAEGRYPNGCEWSTDVCWKNFLATYIKKMPVDPLNIVAGKCPSEAGCYVYRYCRLDEGRSFVLITNLERPKKIVLGNNARCPLGGSNQYWVTN